MTTISVVKLWRAGIFLLLYAVLRSAAQGDPSRIPNADEAASLIPKSAFTPWPECAKQCQDIVSALNSSSEEWCLATFLGSCYQSGTMIRMSKFCSLLDSGEAQCPTTQCIFPGESTALQSWANTVCDLSVDAQQRWNDSTSARAETLRHLPSEEFISRGRPSCINSCKSYVSVYRSSLLYPPCHVADGCTLKNYPKPFVNSTMLCEGLADPMNCTDACTFGLDPRSLYVWLNDTCAQGLFDMETWGVATMAKERAWVSQWISTTLLPWNWTVRAYPKVATFSALGVNITDPAASSTPYLPARPSGPGTCPSSTSEKLGVFAAVNVSMAFLLPIIGRRTVINKLTFGIFGTLGSRWWPVVGILSACLHVVANVANAHLIRSTPGYEDVPFGALVLLWCTRPRLSWLAVFLATVEAEDGMYFGSAAAAITTEAILQGLGAVYFGITANYGRKKKFYLLKHLDPYPRGLDAHMMYSGALLWLVSFTGTLLACFVSIVGLNEVIANAREMVAAIEKARHAILDPQAPPKPGDNEAAEEPLEEEAEVPAKAPRKLTQAEIEQIASVASAGVIFLAFLAQWLFWAGFVRAATERYCPPKLHLLGVIWGIFSAFGIFVGSAH